MLRFSSYITFVLLLCTSLLSAQHSAERPTAEEPFFVDADLGGILIPEYQAISIWHVSLGAGYRLHPHHAVGLEYRRAALDDYYSDGTAQGVGAVYRFTWRGLYAKTSLGAVVGSTHNEYESPIIYDRAGGGYYQNLTLGYRFRSGILLGASFAGFVNMNYDRSRFILDPEFDEGGLFPFVDVREAPAEAGVFVEDGTERFTLPAVTVTVGYAFPGRGRQ